MSRGSHARDRDRSRADFAPIEGSGRSFASRIRGAAPPRGPRLTCKYLLAYYQDTLKGGLDKVFKALADPTRRRLLDQLHRDNGQTLTALCQHMDMTRQAVTQHLQLLTDANLVAVVWRGREKLHYLNPVPLYEIQDRWINKFERSRLAALRDLKRKLEGDDHEQT